MDMLTRERLEKIVKEAINVANDAVMAVIGEKGGASNTSQEARGSVIGPVAAVLVAEALKETGGNISDVLLGES